MEYEEYSGETDNKPKQTISYIALAIGIIALLGVIIILILYFFFKPPVQPGPQGPKGDPGTPGQSNNNMIIYPINLINSTGNPYGSAINNQYTFGNVTIINGTNEFSLSSDNSTITYNGGGGWYVINTSTLFKGGSGMNWLLLRLYYNSNLIQTLNPSNSYDNNSGYYYTYNGAFNIKLAKGDKISLNLIGSYTDSIAMQNTNQNYLSIQQL